MSVVSLVDILKALPRAQASVISQFTAGSSEFNSFASTLIKDGVGYDQEGKPRVRFLQDARAYGPWPRDQAVVDEQRRMWISSADQHQLRGVFSALDQSHGVDRQEARFPFVGANLLVTSRGILYPDRLDTTVLAKQVKGPFIPLPSPKSNVTFHLDLLVMPLSDKVIAVGDDRLVRTILGQLSPEEQLKTVVRWMAEYAASAANVQLDQQDGQLSLRYLDRPALILPSLLEEKFKLLNDLAKPGAFQRAILAEPELVVDDQIAEELRARGFAVVRIPFWMGLAGFENGKKTSGIPMMCYPNCLVWDDGILMPVYGIPPLDEAARVRFEKGSGKKVFPVRGGAMLGYSFSGPHCLTLEFR